MVFLFYFYILYTIYKLKNNMQKNLQEYINEAKQKKVAIGHFNFSSFDVAKAIILAAKELDVPVILGLSEGERDFVGIPEAAAFVRSIKENVYQKVFLNADHTYSVERIAEALHFGFDSVIFDGAKLSMEENLLQAKKCRELIDKYNLENQKSVLFEAELGYIGQSSKVLDSVPDGVELTSVADAVYYTKEANLDLFAPAVGNIHGMLKDVPEPKLDIQRIKEISEATNLPLVLHGASGNTKEDIQEAILAGVAIVHVNTEIRVAYRNALEKVLAEQKSEVAPYKYLKVVEDEVKSVVKEKLEIFNFINK
jgi:fructose-bisphosphate aldolase class II